MKNGAVRVVNTDVNAKKIFLHICRRDKCESNHFSGRIAKHFN